MTMKSEIKQIESPDMICPLEQFCPNKDDEFGILLELSIGLEGEEGADLFQIMVCTPKFLMGKFGMNNIVVGLHYLIVFKYDYTMIYDKLKELFCISGNNWSEISNKLSYYGHWEYQDYRE